MSKDWQIGSGFVKEPKITKDPWTGKDGYSQARTIEATDPTESQTVIVKGTTALRIDIKPVKATWYYFHVVWCY